MTRKTRNILLGMLLFFALAFIASRFINNMENESRDRKITGFSESTVTMNNEPITSYIIDSDIPFVAVEDFQLCGLNITIKKRQTETNITQKSSLSVNTTVKKSSSEIIIPETISRNGKENRIKDVYNAGDYTLISVEYLRNINWISDSNYQYVIEIQSNALQNNLITVTPTPAPEGGVEYASPNLSNGKTVILLDPGHGKSSGAMTDEEKQNSGWVYNENKGQWGEWRHWKMGTFGDDCYGSGCSGRVPTNGSCWYPIGNGDRDAEPDINLQNALAAEKYLEDTGLYEVELTRRTNDENPSITNRIRQCYDIGAAAYVCIHSNAGGGTGSAYIELSGEYDQSNIPSDYVTQSNALGKAINDRIINQTSLDAFSGGCYEGSPELIVFCKSPVICAYLEIGFFDDANDLNILQTESDQIGKAIADGIIEFFTN